jgi:hypothetical protein
MMRPYLPAQQPQVSRPERGETGRFFSKLAGLGLPDALGGRLEPDSDFLLSRANRTPEFIIHDPQMGNFAPDPLFRRVSGATHACQWTGL